MALGLIRTDKVPALHTSDTDVIDNVLHYTTHNKVPTVTARSLVMQLNWNHRCNNFLPAKRKSYPDRPYISAPPERVADLHIFCKR